MKKFLWLFLYVLSTFSGRIQAQDYLSQGMMVSGLLTSAYDLYRGYREFSHAEETIASSIVEGKQSTEVTADEESEESRATASSFLSYLKKTFFEKKRNLLAAGGALVTAGLIRAYFASELSSDGILPGGERGLSQEELLAREEAIRTAEEEKRKEEAERKRREEEARRKEQLHKEAEERAEKERQEKERKAEEERKQREEKAAEAERIRIAEEQRLAQEQKNTEEFRQQQEDERLEDQRKEEESRKETLEGTQREEQERQQRELEEQESQRREDEARQKEQLCKEAKERFEQKRAEKERLEEGRKKREAQEQKKREEQERKEREFERERERKAKEEEIPSFQRTMLADIQKEQDVLDQKISEIEKTFNEDVEKMRRREAGYEDLTIDILEEIKQEALKALEPEKSQLDLKKRFATVTYDFRNFEGDELLKQFVNALKGIKKPENAQDRILGFNPDDINRLADFGKERNYFIGKLVSEMQQETWNSTALCLFFDQGLNRFFIDDKDYRVRLSRGTREMLCGTFREYKDQEKRLKEAEKKKERDAKFKEEYEVERKKITDNKTTDQQIKAVLEFFSKKPKGDAKRKVSIDLFKTFKDQEIADVFMQHWIENNLYSHSGRAIDSYIKTQTLDLKEQWICVEKLILRKVKERQEKEHKAEEERKQHEEQAAQAERIRIAEEQHRAQEQQRQEELRQQQENERLEAQRKAEEEKRREEEARQEKLERTQRQEQVRAEEAQESEGVKNIIPPTPPPLPTAKDLKASQSKVRKQEASGSNVGSSSRVPSRGKDGDLVSQIKQGKKLKSTPQSTAKESKSSSGLGKVLSDSFEKRKTQVKPDIAPAEDGRAEEWEDEERIEQEKLEKERLENLKRRQEEDRQRQEKERVAQEDIDKEREKNKEFVHNLLRGLGVTPETILTKEICELLHVEYARYIRLFGALSLHLTEAQRVVYNAYESEQADAMKIRIARDKEQFAIDQAAKINSIRKAVTDTIFIAGKASDGHAWDLDEVERDDVKEYCNTHFWVALQNRSVDEISLKASLDKIYSKLDDENIKRAFMEWRDEKKL